MIYVNLKTNEKVNYEDYKKIEKQIQEEENKINYSELKREFCNIVEFENEKEFKDLLENKSVSEIMYHASVESFKEFKEEKIKDYDRDYVVNGFWFSSSRRTSCAWENPKYLKTCKIKLKNIAPHKLIMNLYNSYKDLREELLKMGYDGFILNDVPRIDNEKFLKEGKVTYSTVRGNKYILKNNKEYGGIDCLRADTEEIISNYYDMQDFFDDFEKIVCVFKPSSIEVLKEEINKYWS